MKKELRRMNKNEERIKKELLVGFVVVEVEQLDLGLGSEELAVILARSDSVRVRGVVTLARVRPLGQVFVGLCC